MIDPKFIKEVAEKLEAPAKEVAACLRSGEALRCRFLVPFLIRQIEPPDELSKACEPAGGRSAVAASISSPIVRM